MRKEPEGRIPNAAADQVLLFSRKSAIGRQLVHDEASAELRMRRRAADWLDFGILS